MHNSDEIKQMFEAMREHMGAINITPELVLMASALVEQNKTRVAMERIADAVERIATEDELMKRGYK